MFDVANCDGFFLAAAMAVPAMAGLSNAQRKAAINSSAARITAKCNNSGSEYRKCYSHLSKGQCLSIMKRSVSKCKKQASRLTGNFGKAKKEPQKVQKKAIRLILEMCFMEPFIEKKAKNKKAAFYCMKKYRR